MNTIDPVCRKICCTVARRIRSKIARYEREQFPFLQIVRVPAVSTTAPIEGVGKFFWINASVTCTRLDVRAGAGEARSLENEKLHASRTYRRHRFSLYRSTDLQRRACIAFNNVSIRVTTRWILKPARRAIRIRIRIHRTVDASGSSGNNRVYNRV